MITDKAHSVPKQSNNIRKKLDIQVDSNEAASCTMQAKEIKRKAKNKRIKQLEQTRENKTLHD